MKNEGPYILEWLAYHRIVGFEDFLIYTNDCEDGTTEILEPNDPVISQPFKDMGSLVLHR